MELKISSMQHFRKAVKDFCEAESCHIDDVEAFVRGRFSLSGFYKMGDLGQNKEKYTCNLDINAENYLHITILSLSDRNFITKSPNFVINEAMFVSFDESVMVELSIDQEFSYGVELLLKRKGQMW